MSLQILVHIGFLTEESGDVFSPRVLKGGPLGEMVQWADILAALFMLGHSLRVTVSLKELQRWVLGCIEVLGGSTRSGKAGGGSLPACISHSAGAVLHHQCHG